MTDKKYYEYIHQYTKEHYDHINIYAPAGTRQKWKDYAEKRGLSLAQFVTQAVEEYVKIDNA